MLYSLNKENVYEQTTVKTEVGVVSFKEISKKPRHNVKTKVEFLECMEASDYIN
jgi:hypothetical protein